ncbi:MAG: NUDIX hydrolase, partial [Bdellovibrionales bacterium]
MSKKWKVLSSKELFKAGMFSLRTDECELPDGRRMPRYYVVDFPSWIHIVALDERGDLILVRQYRHAAGDEFLEIPGGSMDQHKGETILEAAKRELREETGYISKQWTLLGEHYPNPALQSNRLITYLARDCVFEGEPQLDPFEDLSVEKVPVYEVYKLLEQGEIQHSLMMGSLALARRHL